MNKHNERAELIALLKEAHDLSLDEEHFAARQRIMRAAAMLESQPAREWVGLTDSDIGALRRKHMPPTPDQNYIFRVAAKAADALLREKNAGQPAADDSEVDEYLASATDDAGQPLHPNFKAAAMKPWQIMPTVKDRATNLELPVVGVYEDVVFVDVQDVVPGDGKRLSQELWLGVCNCVFAQCGGVVRTDTLAMKEIRALIDHVCIAIDSLPAMLSRESHVVADDKRSGQWRDHGENSGMRYPEESDLYDGSEHEVDDKAGGEPVGEVIGPNQVVLYAEHASLESGTPLYTHHQPQAEVRVPDGYVLVPVEPTDDMLNCAQDRVYSLFRVDACSIWDAMLAAAPKPQYHEQQTKQR